jgi:hypothetical protein
MTKRLLEGKLQLYSEQGMEGGYLSIQDKEYIDFSSPKYGVSGDVKVWDEDDVSKFGITSNPEIYINESWQPWPDPICSDPDYRISSLFCDEVNGDFNADKRLMEKYNFKLRYTEERANEEYGEGNWKFVEAPTKIMLTDGRQVILGGTPDSIPERPYGIPKDGLTRVTVKWNDGTIDKQRLSNTLLIEGWSYEGLHKLRETDVIKVKDPVTEVIICEGQIGLIPLEIFSQTKKGHFEHINQTRHGANNWEKYFTENYYAELYREIE